MKYYSPNLRHFGFASLIFLLFTGCEQRTDFDACVEYWTSVANEQELSEKDSKQLSIWYIEANCKLSK
ncbi:hypothetical protein VST7929_02916 [Vibrio stylophorae]|uniref:Uncharacterized protein n=1 Tax=Vibrio stylophorae TaxID=659351 RepID=A0ABN8DVA7_9VIBR|nr:hypothetical protein VST7929_02916 [Vibrio stylophorae]